MLNEVPSVPSSATLILVRAPFERSSRKQSGKLFVSPGTRFVEALSKGDPQARREYSLARRVQVFVQIGLGQRPAWKARARMTVAPWFQAGIAAA